VIQQGTVCLWDEKGAEARLYDVRGQGDMLGIDSFHDSRSYPFSARSAGDVFRLEQSALRPLVDVGRVFGMAAGKVFGTSTFERFEMACKLLPQHTSIFREAAETLRVALWQQGRIGISQRTSGSDLPPALLSRYDRQILRSGFRSISRLLEFTADFEWLKSL
jgi:signal-transduction protein with cAMP-binding, CBS, and nucleotidyltransferase domain